MSTIICKGYNLKIMSLVNSRRGQRGTTQVVDKSKYTFHVPTDDYCSRRSIDADEHSTLSWIFLLVQSIHLTEKMFQLAIFFVALIVILTFIHLWIHCRRVGRYVDKIPGPSALPVIGNSLQFIEFGSDDSKCFNLSILWQCYQNYICF